MQPNQPRLSLNISSSRGLPPAGKAFLSSFTAEMSELEAPDFTDTLLTPTTPGLPRTPVHVRRKTYAGDLAAATRTAVRDYQERIALLESQTSRMSVELEAARDALVDEREERQIERHSLIITSPPPSSSQTALDNHIHEQSEVLYERKLRMEILETLKKIRAQNSTLARSLREQQDKCVSISSVLEAERVEKQSMEEEIQRLSQKNFMLYEHNKLLVGRDSALQQDISTLITKCQADEWMRGVLEAELREVRKSSPTLERFQIPTAEAGPTITLEDQGPLRAQLVAARDELHITQLRLEESEKKCGELDERVRSLQQNMSQCLDSSAQALEVERELRAEVAEHARLLESKNESLMSDMGALKLEVEELKRKGVDNAQAHAVVAENGTLRRDLQASEIEVEELRRSKISAGFKAAHINQQPLCGNVQKVTVDVRNICAPITPVGDLPVTEYNKAAKLKMLRRERLLDRQLRAPTSKRSFRRRSSLRVAHTTSSVMTSPSADISAVSPSAPIFRLSDPPGSGASTLAEHLSRPSSPSKCLLEHPSCDTRPLRRPKLLRLRSPPSLQTEHIFGEGGDAVSRSPSHLLTSPVLPLVPPSTPLKSNNSPRRSETRANSIESEDGLFRFRPLSSHSPDSPDSTVSTLVATYSASKTYTMNKARSVVIPTALLRRLPSFGGTLKASSTLSLDVHKQHDVQGVSDTAKSMRNSTGRGSRAEIRRASAVLVHIAQTSGIDGLHEWLVV